MGTIFNRPDAATLKKQQKYLQYDKYFFTLQQLF